MLNMLLLIFITVLEEEVWLSGGQLACSLTFRCVEFGFLYLQSCL